MRFLTFVNAFYPLNCDIPTMKSYVILIVVLSLLVSGCIAGEPPSSLNERPLVRFAYLDAKGIFATDHAGRRIAIADKGLVLTDAEGKGGVRLDTISPLALSWDPDGSALAAAFATDAGTTRIAVYQADGALKFERELAVTFNRLNWSRRGDLLVVGHVLKVYSFGGNLRMMLYHFDGGDIDETLLADTTIKPATVKRYASHLAELLPVAFSADGDEVIYARLHDPPEFPAFLQLVYRNWQAEGTRLLQRLPVTPGLLAWGSDDACVTVRSRDGSVVTTPVWPGGGGEVTEQLPAGASTGIRRMQIFGDGSYLLAAGGRLYRGEGLAKPERSVYDATAWRMRLWRFEGLITPEEFKTYQQRKAL